MNATQTDPADTMSAQTATAAMHNTGPTLRDLSQKCRVRPFIGNYVLVTTETGHTYRVEAVWLAGDVEARCQCPIRKYRQRQCRHELAAITFERSRVASAQFN